MEFVFVLAFSVLTALGTLGATFRHVIGLPTPPALSAFWQQHAGSLGADGLPSASGMSAYWQHEYTEQRSAVTVYGVAGVGVSLPSDTYTLVPSVNPRGPEPIAIQVETVAAALTNPLANVASGVTNIGTSVVLHTAVAQRTILDDSAWVENVHITSKLNAHSLAKVNGLGGYVSTALSDGSKFYRLVVVEKALPDSQEQVAMGVFLTPKAPPISMARLLNSLPS